MIIRDISKYHRDIMISNFHTNFPLLLILFLELELAECLWFSPKYLQFNLEYFQHISPGGLFIN